MVLEVLRLCNRYYSDPIQMSVVDLHPHIYIIMYARKVQNIKAYGTIQVRGAHYQQRYVTQ